MEPFILEKDAYFFVNEWTERFPGLVAGFTSRNGGFNETDFTTMNLGLHVNDAFKSVRRNRQHIANSLDFPLNHWVGAEQTHGKKIEKVMKNHAGKGSLLYEESFKETDGLYSVDKGILLTLCFADCVPLLFCHGRTRSIGTAHAGWKGTVNGIAEEMVKLFQMEGIDEKEIDVIIGPSICGNCYIVDEPVISLVQNRLEDTADKPYSKIKDNQYYLDLKKVNKEILLKAGILEENIKVSQFCTSCHEEHFFSYRRDKGKTGRMMSFIGWKEDLQV